jgi:hypothetical protein
MSTEKSNDTIWDRTSDLQIFSTDLNHCATLVPKLERYFFIIMRQEQVTVVKETVQPGTASHQDVPYDVHFKSKINK